METCVVFHRRFLNQLRKKATGAVLILATPSATKGDFSGNINDLDLPVIEE